MVSTVASLGILVSANVAPAMKAMDEVGGKVKDVGETSQKEGKKTEGFMKRWGTSFAVIGAAATAVLYGVIKASPLLAGAMQEAQDAISLLFMTIGDALEPVIRPFIDMLWEMSDAITSMPEPLGGLTGGLIVFGAAIIGAAGGLALLSGFLKTTLPLAAGAGVTAIGGVALSTIGAAGAVVAAAGLLIWSVWNAYENWDQFCAGMEKLMGNLGGTFDEGFGGIIDRVYTSGTWWGTIFETLFILPIHSLVAIMGYWYDAAVWIFDNIKGPLEDLGNFVIEVIGKITDAWNGLMELLGAEEGAPIWRKILALVSPIPSSIAGLFGYQHGGYVPYTGPAMLHAGEYVTPAGRVGAGVGGGAIYNITNNFEINNPILGSEMDVDRLKQRLDGLYKRDMGLVA